MTNSPKNLTLAPCVATALEACSKREYVLPECPPANRYWRHARGVTYLSKEAKAYRLAVQEEAAGPSLPLAGPVYLRMVWYRGRKSGDLDGRLKQLLDSLQGIAYNDDAQIVSIYAHRREDKGRARIEVEVGRVSE